MLNSSHNDKQSEFFSDLSQPPKRAWLPRFNLGKIAVSLSYENILILTIGLIMLLIVCYCLGVEKGKLLASVNQGIQAEQIQLKGAADIQSHQQQRPPETSEIKSPAPKQTTTKVVIAARPKFTIQVATFRNSAFVSKEIQRLEHKGYRAFVICRGKLSEICVGNYQSKTEASANLRDLRKLYADCYIRNQ